MWEGSWGESRYSSLKNNAKNIFVSFFKLKHTLPMSLIKHLNSQLKLSFMSPGPLTPVCIDVRVVVGGKAALYGRVNEDKD